MIIRCEQLTNEGLEYLFNDAMHRIETGKRNHAYVLEQLEVLRNIVSEMQERTEG